MAVVSPDTIAITSSAWRIVEEPDKSRGEYEPFPPVSQSLFWLRRGIDPNALLNEANTPFVVEHNRGEDKYIRDVVGALRFYPEFSRMWNTDTGETVLVGEIDNKKRRRTIPAVIIGQEINERRKVVHTFIPKVPVR